MQSYYIWSIFLLLCIFVLKFLTRRNTKQHLEQATSSETVALTHDDDDDDDKPNECLMSKSFKSFQQSYVLVFLTVMLADWMQGPYVYKLYEKYDYEPQQIAVLFVIGFGSSGICGTFIGTFADKFGRKLSCILFCILYAVCCLTKHFGGYWVLLFGRFLGGVSTSILFSCFEAWMVSEHINRNFPTSKLGSTFELAWGLNSIVAVCAGFITSFAVRMYRMFNIAEPAEVAAFDCSAVVLICAMVFICKYWSENTGNTNVNAFQSVSNACNVLRDNLSVTLVGCVQSGFEAAMYLFVFMWTLALQTAYTVTEQEGDLDHGVIFAVFMESCYIGTMLSGLMTSQNFLHWTHEKFVTCVCIVAGVSLCIAPYSTYEIRLFLFVLFELCVGCYFPVIGTLRSRYVPEDVRATILNIFRVPLNIIVVCTLMYLDNIGMNVFQLCAILLLLAALSSYCLSQPSHLKKYNKETIQSESENH